MKFKKKPWRYIWQRQTCSYNVRVPRFLGRHHVLDSSLWKKRFAFDTRFKSPSVKRQSRSPRGNSKLLDIFLISSNQLFNKMVILLTVFILLAVILKMFRLNELTTCVMSHRKVNPKSTQKPIPWLMLSLLWKSWIWSKLQPTTNSCVKVQTKVWNWLI